MKLFKTNPNSLYFIKQKIKKSYHIVLHEPISAIIAGITIFLQSMPFLVAGYGITYGALIKIALIGAALWSAASSMAKKPKGQINNGHLINTRSTSEPIRPIYGTYKVGGNYVFLCPSGLNNKYLNIVVTWGEGPVSGIAKDIETKPEYLTTAATELDDLAAHGKYSGATYSCYQVKITVAAVPDQFAWRTKVGAGAWGAWSGNIVITGAWQDLDLGVRIKFSATTGHTLGTSAKYWQFYAGDGVWLGEHLMYYYMSFGPGSLDLIDHTFYDGSSTQTVDATLQGDCPTWNDAMRYTSYSIFKLKYNENAFTSLPEFYITINGLEIHDPRDALYPSDVAAWSNNAALVSLDMLTTSRYSFGLDTTLIDETSWEAIATWCDPDEVTNGAVNYTCIQNHTSAAGDEPGVGANWHDYWEIGGSAGVAWQVATAYESGYQFNGCILDRQAFIDTFEDILLNFKGFIAYSEGKYKLKTFTDDASVMTLTEADIEISPESFSIDVPGIPETPTKVKIAYSDPTIGYQTNWVYDEDSTIVGLGEDPKEIDMSLIGTSSMYQATKLARYYRLRNQTNKQFKILGHPRCYALEQGDMVSITHEFPSWTTQKVRVMDIGIPQGGMIPITFLEEATAIYASPGTIVIPTPPVNPPPIPGPSVSVVSGVAVADCNVDDNLATAEIVVAWTDNDSEEGVIDYEIQIAEQGAPGTPTTLPIGGLGFGHEEFGHWAFGHGTTIQYRTVTQS